MLYNTLRITAAIQTWTTGSTVRHWLLCFAVVVFLREAASGNVLDIFTWVRMRRQLLCLLCANSKRLKFKWQFKIETVVSQTGWQRSAKERDWWREGGKGDEHNFRQVKYPRAQLGHRFVSRCSCCCCYFCYCYEIITLIYLAGLRWEHFLAFVCTYVCVYMWVVEYSSVNRDLSLLICQLTQNSDTQWHR